MAEAVTRALAERRAVRPSSRDEARALFEQLLKDGIPVAEKDNEAFLASSEWYFDELAPASDPEESQAGADAEGADEDEKIGQHHDADRDEVFFTLGGDDPKGIKEFPSHVPAISWALHCFAPDWFVPYAFEYRFDQFEAICNEFAIPLPRLPGKASHVARCRYYLDLNDALTEFRLAQGMSPAEFLAFLYGFCMKQVPPDEVPELPEARRACPDASR